MLKIEPTGTRPTRDKTNTQQLHGHCTLDITRSENRHWAQYNTAEPTKENTKASSDRYSETTPIPPPSRWAMGVTYGHPIRVMDKWQWDTESALHCEDLVNEVIVKISASPPGSTVPPAVAESRPHTRVNYQKLTTGSTTWPYPCGEPHGLTHPKQAFWWLGAGTATAGAAQENQSNQCNDPTYY